MVARPMTSRELLDGADLAGIARVVSVSRGQAHLRFSKLLKGRPRGSDFLHRLGLSRNAIVSLRSPIDEPVLGPWTDAGAYVPGEHVKTHLIWDPERQVYETMWWNAVTSVGAA
jgi:hypothetical protein